MLNPQKHGIAFSKGISQTLWIHLGQELICGRSWLRQQNMLTCIEMHCIPSALLLLIKDQGRDMGFFSSLCLHHAAQSTEPKMVLMFPCWYMLSIIPPEHPSSMNAEPAASFPILGNSLQREVGCAPSPLFPTDHFTQVPADLCAAACKL